SPGMELTGTVLNVVDFGWFVDIGMHDSGLVHVSHLADRFVRDPHELVCVGDVVRVWVLSIDKERRRVSLSMVQPGTERPHPPRHSHSSNASAQFHGGKGGRGHAHAPASQKENIAGDSAAEKKHPKNRPHDRQRSDAPSRDRRGYRSKTDRQSGQRGSHILERTNEGRRAAISRGVNFSKGKGQSQNHLCPLPMA
ncbi:MAG: S1 RNA-binding domain-containing protein, partial [Thermoguttaceae bacterium]